MFSNLAPWGEKKFLGECNELRNFREGLDICVPQEFQNIPQGLSSVGNLIFFCL